jgi:hypothetical protein
MGTIGVQDSTKRAEEFALAQRRKKRDQNLSRRRAAMSLVRKNSLKILCMNVRGVSSEMKKE